MFLCLSLTASERYTEWNATMRSAYSEVILGIGILLGLVQLRYFLVTSNCHAVFFL